MSLSGELSIERMCALAPVSRASFYRSLEEPEADAEEMELRAAIQTAFLAHKRRYGYRRITAELRRQGWRVNRKRVQRLMQTDNLLGLQPRAYVSTTDSRHRLTVALNLAKRLKVTGINQLWVADITYIRLQQEFVYLAVVLDAHSRKVVGWALDRRMTTALPQAALTKALATEQPPPGLVHHSDRGAQYAAHDYVQLLEQHEIIPSMSRAGNPYDNASCESWMKTLKQEEIYANRYRDLEHLRANLELFIDEYYNRQRLHSALGYKTPAEFAQAFVPTPATAAATMSFSRHGEIYRPDVIDPLTRKDGLSAVLPPIGHDESPIGYSSASCSPAALASASPINRDGAASAGT